MGEYVDGQNVLLRRPEPGRTYGLSNPKKEENKENKENKVDTNAIADAVIKAITSRINVQGTQNISINKDNFDDSNSLRELAKTMSVSKDVNDSNLKGLGVTKEIKKDNKETNNTIDLLSKLGD